ncbi:MAG: glycosyltransferase [Deltaproteobacteria bacterium]|jgi:glycosyltransferase involved in cell wall biosynthesis|nr:glycosyltransferase [Deltaproteobacteria bacterium]
MTSHLFFVSAIIPVYNGGAFLREAVESIRQQDYEPLEIIIVDDGSTDNTKEVAAGFGKEVRYVYQPNSGLPATRNKGLKMARGNVIAFLDVDDLWSKDKLKIQNPLLKESPFTEIVLGHTQILMLTGIIDGKHTFKEWSDPVLAMSVCSTVFRRSVFDKVGLFDETQRYGDDWDWFMRARELGVEMVIHKEVIHLYRRHGQNMTNQQALNNHYFIRLLKKSLDRRRFQSEGMALPLLKVSELREESAERRSISAEDQEEI